MIDKVGGNILRFDSPASVQRLTAPCFANKSFLVNILTAMGAHAEAAYKKVIFDEDVSNCGQHIDSLRSRAANLAISPSS